jgi:site-specific DNA recombinase
MTAAAATTTAAEWIIYLRQSDFRGDDPDALTARADELGDLAGQIGVTARVAIENDVDLATGRIRGASASRATRRVTAANGLVELRTYRPVYDGVLLDLQRGAAAGLLVSDESRIARDHRDGMGLLDACREGRASCVALDDDGGPRWVLTNGGTRAERDRFQDRIEDARRYVADLRAKVAKGRRRWAGKSYQGGRRPFGYERDEHAPEHHKRLITVEAEAGVIRWAADQVLRGVSLKWCARELRDREPRVPTASGTAWSAEALRAVLLKPSVAGLAVRDGAHVPAPDVIPDPILDRDTWDRLRALLLDPARRTNTSRANEPRWLVSGFATCGARLADGSVCGGPMRAGGGRDRAHAYIGKGCCHVRRTAAKVDAVVEATVLALLERPDVLERLRPPARPGIDVAALRAELERLDGQAARHRDASTAGLLADVDLYPLLAAIRKRQAAIGEELATSSAAPDPLAEFREAPARTAWEALPMPRRRAVVQYLCDAVVIERAGRRGAGFDPDTVTVTPRPGLAG